MVSFIILCIYNLKVPVVLTGDSEYNSWSFFGPIANMETSIKMSALANSTNSSICNVIPALISRFDMTMDFTIIEGSIYIGITRDFCPYNIDFKRRTGVGPGFLIRVEKRKGSGEYTISLVEGNTAGTCSSRDICTADEVGKLSITKDIESIKVSVNNRYCGSVSISRFLDESQGFFMILASAEEKFGSSEIYKISLSAQPNVDTSVEDYDRQVRKLIRKRESSKEKGINSHYYKVLNGDYDNTFRQNFWNHVSNIMAELNISASSILTSEYVTNAVESIIRTKLEVIEKKLLKRRSFIEDTNRTVSDLRNSVSEILKDIRTSNANQLESIASVSRSSVERMLSIINSDKLYGKLSNHTYDIKKGFSDNILRICLLEGFIYIIYFVYKAYKTNNFKNFQYKKQL